MQIADKPVRYRIRLIYLLRVLESDKGLEDFDRVKLSPTGFAGCLVSISGLTALLPLCFVTDFHRCNKVLSAKDQDTAPCDWYRRVYKSLCPISWVSYT